MLSVFGFGRIGVVLGHIYFVDPNPAAGQEGAERGVRVEVRFIQTQDQGGSIYAARPILVGEPIWRLDLLESADGAPGSFDRTHHHPAMRGWEPGRRKFERELSADPLGFLGERLRDLPGLLAQAELPPDAVDEEDVHQLRDYADDVVAATATMLERVRRGELAGLAGAIFCQRVAPSLHAVEVAGLVQSDDEAAEVMRRLRPTFEEESATSPFRFLAVSSGFGHRVLFSREPVRSLADLRAAMAALFSRYAPFAIAVKSQHAYSRTLLWREREDADAERVLQSVLAGQDPGEAERDCLGDWCLARGVELAIEHDLPFKIHTGYYAGHSRMPVERIRAGQMYRLLQRYPDARFVLMHIAYPYDAELAAIAKHYRNVYVDLCWAWSIDPYSAGNFVRRFIHSVPINKLFVFGGDCPWPNSSIAYAAQSRRWLTRTLQAEIDEGLLTEAQAIQGVLRLMRENQLDCFDIQGKRDHLRAVLAGQPG